MKPSSINSLNFPTAYCQSSQPPTPHTINHSMTITIHQGSDAVGPIAGLLNRSASKLLFNVSHNSPKQSGFLSISCARPFKWVWYMTHKGLQVSTPQLWEERGDSRVDRGRWAWIKCMGFGDLHVQLADCGINAEGGSCINRNAQELKLCWDLCKIFRDKLDSHRCSQCDFSLTAASLFF